MIGAASPLPFRFLAAKYIELKIRRQQQPPVRSSLGVSVQLYSTFKATHTRVRTHTHISSMCCDAYILLCINLYLSMYLIYICRNLSYGNEMSISVTFQYHIKNVLLALKLLALRYIKNIDDSNGRLTPMTKSTGGKK